jgi:sulfur carrier protein ThiS
MRIYLGGHLNFYLQQPSNWLEVEINKPTPLIHILERIGIPTNEVHLVVINEINVDLQQAIVSEQDDVKLFSAVGGG